MKPHIFSILAGAFLLTGCSKQEDKSAAPAPEPAKTNASGNPLTAPADYVGALGKAKGLAEKTVDNAGLNQAVQLFNAQEGRLPKDLQELVTQKYLPAIPQAPYGMKIEYNPKTGQVSIVKAQ
jgi:hypothetical protein